MKSTLEKLKHIERSVVVFVAVTLLCTASIAALLNFYFAAYQNPYMRQKIFDLSEGWQYETPGFARISLDSLRNGPKLAGGETMTMYRPLDIELPKAAILIRTNHQSINVWLSDMPLYITPYLEPGANPGMALHFLALPEDYSGKVLKIELTSPYALYSGRTSPILLGTIPSLEAYTMSLSMRPLIFMSISLALGMTIIAFAFIQGLSGAVHWEQLAIGIFAVILALYYVCTDYIVFQFFTPFWVSTLSMGLYFSFHVPLVLFFYFSFERYKKRMLPAVILHSAFPVIAITLQAFGLVDLPRLVNQNNLLLGGLIYTIALTVMEAIKKNRIMVLAAPFFILAYGFMLFNFAVFYNRQGVVPYSYRDTYFLLILIILIYSVWHFFRGVYRQKRENELLSLQNSRAQSSYEQVKAHLREAAGLKHEIKNHFSAMQAYLEHGQVEDARDYLSRYAEQSVSVTETVYSESLLLNAILSNLYQRSREHGIKIELDLSAVPQYIADPDLYSLLSNLTENALEACMAMPEGRERFIRLTMNRREPYFNIRCVNSKSGDVISESGIIQTTKAEGGHGYGLWTIGRIVDAYDGIMHIQYDDDTFTVMAALKDK